MNTHANPTHRAALAVVVLALSACTNMYSELRPEAEIPLLAQLGTEAEALPSTVTRYPVDAPTGEPVRVALEQTGNGDGQRLVVMIHGVLSDRSAWRYVVGSLGRDHDLVLVDLPGSGDSDKPDPDLVGEAFYAPESLARATLDALQQHLGGQAGAKQITVMAHSLGGRVVLAMLSDPQLQEDYADVLQQVDTAVLLAGLDVRVERQYENFRRIAELSDIEAGIGDLLGILPRECANVTYHYAEDPQQLPREVLDRLIAILSDGETRHAQQAVLRQAVPFDADGRPDFDRMTQMETEYRELQIPVLILWGARDENLPLSMGYKLAAELPQASLRVFPSCTHALPTERPVLVAELARRFMTRGGIAGERISRLDDVLPETRTADAVARHWQSSLTEATAVPPGPARSQPRR